MLSLIICLPKSAIIILAFDFVVFFLDLILISLQPSQLFCIRTKRLCSFGPTLHCSEGRLGQSVWSWLAAFAQPLAERTSEEKEEKCTRNGLALPNRTRNHYTVSHFKEILKSCVGKNSSFDQNVYLKSFCVDITD